MVGPLSFPKASQRAEAPPFPPVLVAPAVLVAPPLPVAPALWVPAPLLVPALPGLPASLPSSACDMDRPPQAASSNATVTQARPRRGD